MLKNKAKRGVTDDMKIEKELRRGQGLINEDGLSINEEKKRSKGIGINSSP